MEGTNQDNKWTKWTCMTTTKTGAGRKAAVELIQRIVKEFTFHHDTLAVSTEDVAGKCVVVIQAHAADTPRLIGGGGLNFKGLSVLVAAIGNRFKEKLLLKVADPVVGSKERYEKFHAVENWNREKIIGLLKDTCAVVFQHPVMINVGDLNRETSLITIQLSRLEDQRFVEPIGKALGIVWNAVGKANGRDLKLDVEVEGGDSVTDLGQMLA